MTLTAGTSSVLATTSTTASLSSTAATGGTGAVTYQWYKSTVSGFTPGGGNIIAGATSLTLNDSGNIPGTVYYYEMQATDTTPTTVSYAQVQAVTSTPVLSQNQFQQAPYLGQVDQAYNYNTKSAVVDQSQATPVTCGQAMKVVNSAGGAPKLVACTSNSDVFWGFVNFDLKTLAFGPGSPLEVSMAGNVIYLYATGPIARGAQVCLDLTTVGGVQNAVTSSGNTIVGFAYDQAPAAGTLIRVEVGPRFKTA